MRMKPPINKAKKIRVKRSKYFSNQPSIFPPSIRRRSAINKNLAALPISEAWTKVKTDILNKPAAMVITLKGIGVNAAVKTVMKAFSAYFLATRSKVASRWYIFISALPMLS